MNIEMKQSKLNIEPGSSNYVDKTQQNSMNEDVEMVNENELNAEPVQREVEGTSDSNESISEGTSDTDSNESESEEKEYVTAIRNILGIVKKPGTFACGGVLANAKLQLSVKGVGEIKFPLSVKQGNILKSKCKAAPFGRGSDTLVNKSVRNAWQVDAKDVTLDEEFDLLIKKKIAQIIQTLMGKSFTEIKQVKHELYKLVYYKKGGHFIAHRDTEKAPGMFATLVIQLPAAHEGGDLVVRHKGETKVFDFEDDNCDIEEETDSDNSEDDTSHNFYFTAFFADCQHELRKIISGHRLVLIYNLIRNNPNSTSHQNNDYKPSNNQNFMTTMKNSVEEWKSDNNGPQYLALKLDHLYTDTNTSFQNMKGKDKHIADALCSCADIEVYIATLTKNEKRIGYNDDPPPYGGKPDLMSEDEVETLCSYILHNLIDVNNEKPPFGKLELHTSEMLLKEKFIFEKYEERIDSDYEYTGNEGCKVDYFYKKKAIVFWPRGKYTSSRPHRECDLSFSFLAHLARDSTNKKKRKRKTQYVLVCADD